MYTVNQANGTYKINKITTNVFLFVLYGAYPCAAIALIEYQTKTSTINN